MRLRLVGMGHTKKIRTNTARGLPSHLKSNPELLRNFRSQANGLRGLYGEPVYLVGSALLEPNTKPRDWDIRIELPDDVFSVKYGNIDDWITEGENGNWSQVRWRWSDDCVKQSRKISAALGLNVDFQVYPIGYAKMFYWKQPRARLDTRSRK